MFTYTKKDILDALNEYDKSTLALSDEKIEEIKSRELLKPAFERLEKCREYYKNRDLYAIPFSMFIRYRIDGNRSEFEGSEKGYFVRRGHLKTWALSLLFDKDNPEYKQRLEDIIWAICDEYSWCLPAHNMLPLYDLDLFAAETTGALAEILFLLGDKLHPQVVERAKNELIRRGIDNFGNHTNEDFLWSKTTNRQGNWTPVCGGSVGIAAMYMMEDNEKLAEYLLRINNAIELYFDAYPSDGACPEGIGYWGYGFGFFSVYADMLYRRTGGKINLFNYERVKELATFPSKLIFDGSRCVAFSDCDGSRGGLSYSITSLLKKHYPDMVIPSGTKLGYDVEVTGCHRFVLNLRTFLWIENELSENKEEEKTYIFDKTQWYVSTGADKFSFCCKAGHNDEHHNHNDVGTFQVFKNGEEFFADIGSGVYSGKYFGAERYTFIQAGSQGHNVPIVNGKYQKFGKEHCAENVIFDENGMKADISRAYELEELKKLNRTFVFDKKEPCVHLIDEYELSDDGISVTERFISRIEPKVEDGKITLNEKAGAVSLYFDSALLEAAANAMDTEKGRIYITDIKVKNPTKNMKLEFLIK